MDGIELKCEIMRNGYTISGFAEAIGMSKKALYYKLSGKSMFKQSEIQRISSALNLSNDRIISIFFNPEVS